MEWVFVVILVGLFGAKFVIARRRLRQANQRARGDQGTADGGAPGHLPGGGDRGDGDGAR